MAFVEIRIVEYDVLIDNLNEDDDAGWNEWAGWCATWDGLAPVLVISVGWIEIEG